MYKWGFFILLGVNSILLGRQVFVEKEYKVHITQEVAPKAHQVVIRKAAPTVVKHSEKATGKISILLNEIEELDSQVKNQLLDSFKEDARESFSYYFQNNQFSQDKRAKVELILAAFEHYRYDCFGELSMEEYLTKRLSSAGFDEGEIQDLQNLFKKQTAFDHIIGLRIDETVAGRDINLLVDEVYEHDLEIFKRDIFESFMKLDPFEDADPFVVPDTYEDEPLSEAKIQLLKREEILNMIESLNEAGLDYYYKRLEIYGKYMPIDDDLNLKILQIILSY